MMVTFVELRGLMDDEFRRHFRTKRDFVEFAQAVDGRTRIGGPKGKGRITAKRALALLGVPYAQ